MGGGKCTPHRYALTRCAFHRTSVALTRDSSALDTFRNSMQTELTELLNWSQKPQFVSPVFCGYKIHAAPPHSPTAPPSVRCSVKVTSIGLRVSVLTLAPILHACLQCVAINTEEIQVRICRCSAFQTIVQATASAVCSQRRSTGLLDARAGHRCCNARSVIHRPVLRAIIARFGTKLVSRKTLLSTLVAG